MCLGAALALRATRLAPRPRHTLRALPMAGLRWFHGAEGEKKNMFKVEEMAVRLIEALAPVVLRVKGRDKSLADQITRAATSVLLNLGEGNYSDPGNRRARWFTASGSAVETRLALRAAVGWRYCSHAEVAAAQALLDNIVPILWKLTH